MRRCTPPPRRRWKGTREEASESRSTQPNRAFMQVYFDLLHRPREAEGVDFWWIDWQQGATSAMAGLDPFVDA